MNDQQAIEGLLSLLFFIIVVWGTWLYINRNTHELLNKPTKRTRFQSEKTEQEKRWEENAK